MEETVKRLRELADRRLEVEQLMEHAVSCLGSKLSPFSFGVALVKAFGVPVDVLRNRIDGWVGLGLPGCDLSTSEVVAALEPFVAAFQHREVE
jgi:hypothetical protein